MDREQKLRKLASKAAGLRYDSKRAQKILDAEDWSQFYPIVDNQGNLTGAIIGSQEAAGYSNVDDMAMVANRDLTPEQIASVPMNGNMEGYVNLFPKKGKKA